MDWSTHDAPRAGRTEPPAPEEIDIYWRVMGPSLKELCCCVFRTDVGLELRCGYGIDDVLRSQRLDASGDGRYLAAAWLIRVLEKGSFTVLTSSVDDELAEIRAYVNEKHT